jgi:hypothetical protein
MAQSRDQRNALRRVNTFLGDPERADKFFKLTKAQQGKILDKVEMGSTKNAAADVDQFDKNRLARLKARRETRKRARDYAGQTNRRGVNRPVDEDSLFWAVYKEEVGAK